MPNLKVLQDQPEQLKSQLYGFDGANVRPLLTDNTGRTDIRPLSSSTDSIAISATNLDIRDLTNATDNVLVYGNDGTTNRVILTNNLGQTDIRPLTTADQVTVSATNLDVRDLTNATDNVLVYGNDGTTNRVILTNASGQTDIRPLTTADQVTVSATNLDVRDLTNATDNVLVYGNDGTTNRIILTNASGQTDIRPLTAADQVTVSATDLDIRDLSSATDSVTAIVSVSHTEPAADNVTTSDTYAGTGQDVSTWRTFSFFIENTSATAVSGTVKIQISPDNTKWVDDGAEYILEQNETTVLVTSKYLRYARVAYKSTVAATPANLSISFQAQS